MTRFRVATLLSVLAAMAVLVSATPAPAAPTTAFTVTGAVNRPLTLTADQLRRFPTRHAWVRFESGTGTQRHSYVGARLYDVLTATEPTFDPAVKNDQLTFTVLVSATDGYQVAVAWAEFDPGFAGTEVLLAYREDGRRLERPRLVVPSDTKGGRYVSDITGLVVASAAR